MSSNLTFSKNLMPFPFLPVQLLEHSAKTGRRQCQSVECEWNRHRKTLWTLVCLGSPCYTCWVCSLPRPLSTCKPVSFFDIKAWNCHTFFWFHGSILENMCHSKRLEWFERFLSLALLRRCSMSAWGALGPLPFVGALLAVLSPEIGI